MSREGIDSAQARPKGEAGLPDNAVRVHSATLAKVDTKLAAFNAWLRARGRILLMLALLVAGAALTLNGLLGLIRPT